MTNFLHLGQGTSVTSTIPGTPPQFVNPGPGSSLISLFLSHSPSLYLNHPSPSFAPHTNPQLTPPLGTFHWQGSDNPTWFLCPRPGPGYQVLKDVGGNENWGACLSGIALVALDYAGAEPAAGVYL